MGILRWWVGEPSTINTRATVDDGTLNTRSYYLCFDFRVIVTCANHFRGFALRYLGCCDTPSLQRVSYTNMTLGVGNPQMAVPQVLLPVASWQVGLGLIPWVHVGLKTVGINPVPFRTDFYILPPRFRIFGQIRNQYEIRDVKFENGSKTV